MHNGACGAGIGNKLRVKALVVVSGDDEQRKAFIAAMSRSLAASNYGEIMIDAISQSDYGDTKSSQTSMKNAFKRTLPNPRPILIMDQRNASRKEWQKYVKMANEHTDFVTSLVGVDLTGECSQLKADSALYLERPTAAEAGAKIIEHLAFTRSSL